MVDDPLVLRIGTPHMKEVWTRYIVRVGREMNYSPCTTTSWGQVAAHAREFYNATLDASPGDPGLRFPDAKTLVMFLMENS